MVYRILRRSVAGSVLLCSALLVISCAGTPDREWDQAVLGPPGSSGTAEDTQGADGPELYTNSLQVSGVSLSLPDSWRAHRPIRVPDADIVTSSVLFQENGNTVGWFRSYRLDSRTEPGPFITIFMDRTVPADAALDLRGPDAEAGRGYYHLRWYDGTSINDTAIWTARTGLELNRAFAVTYLVDPERLSEGEAQAGNGEPDVVPALPPEAAAERERIFASARALPRPVSGRVQPWNELRFVSLGAWHWTTDIEDGLLLTGAVRELPAVAGIRRVPEETDPSSFFSEVFAAPAEEDGLDARFLLNNMPVDARGAWGRADDGRLQACYVLAADATTGPWAFYVTVDESDAAEASLEPDELHQIPAVRDLFERELFFAGQEDAP